MKIVTTAELLALRGGDGWIRVDTDLRIECDVSREIGTLITGLEVSGYLECHGDLDCGGNLTCGRNLICRGNLTCGGDLDCRGYLDCGGNLTCRGNLTCGGFLTCRGNLHVEGRWIWSGEDLPQVAGRMTHGEVLPPASAREYWAARTGLDLSGCYDDIIPRVQAELPRLIGLGGWTPVNQWMLGSLDRLAAGFDDGDFDRRGNRGNTP